MKKKKRVLLLLLLPALLLLVGSCSGLFSQAAPDQAVAESRLKSLSSGENYRFVSRCHVNTEGEDREYFLLSGEKAGQNSHFRGSILGTELELYLVEDLLYQRNGQSNWRVNQVPQVQQVASLFAELDPAAAFSCTGIEDFEYLGPDESSPGRPHLLRLRPLAVGWVGEYFTNVRYQLWLSRRGQELLRAELQAELKEDPDTRLSLQLELYDMGEPLVISPPVPE